MSNTTNGSKISIDIANEKIERFINDYYTSGKVPIKSLIFDAQMLRDYLNSNESIQNIKFMMGVHDYQKPDGGMITVPTMVIVGYDNDGNYIKDEDNMVLDTCIPCPPTCPTVGDAQNDRIS